MTRDIAFQRSLELSQHHPAASKARAPQRLWLSTRVAALTSSCSPSCLLQHLIPNPNLATPSAGHLLVCHHYWELSLLPFLTRTVAATVIVDPAATRQRRSRACRRSSSLLVSDMCHIESAPAEIIRNERDKQVNPWCVRGRHPPSRLHLAGVLIPQLSIGARRPSLCRRPHPRTAPLQISGTVGTQRSGQPDAKLGVTNREDGFAAKERVAFSHGRSASRKGKRSDSENF